MATPRVELVHSPGSMATKMTQSFFKPHLLCFLQIVSILRKGGGEDLFVWDKLSWTNALL